jgi:hypothetical protein
MKKEHDEKKYLKAAHHTITPKTLLQNCSI